MARLDQTQMLVGIQPAYGISRFDKGNAPRSPAAMAATLSASFRGSAGTSSTAPRPISSSASR
jgi:hypothetical protein